MKSSFLIAIFFAAQASASGLCLKEEKTYFSCDIAKNKLVSVCGSQDLTAKSGYLLYRSGAKNKLEYEFPSRRSGSAKKFFYGTYNHYPARYLTLTFTVSATKHIITFAFDGDRKNPVATVGIQLWRKGAKAPSMLECRSMPDIDIQDLKDIVSCDPTDKLNSEPCEEPES